MSLARPGYDEGTPRYHLPLYAGGAAPGSTAADQDKENCTYLELWAAVEDNSLRVIAETRTHSGPRRIVVGMGSRPYAGTVLAGRLARVLRVVART